MKLCQRMVFVLSIAVGSIGATESQASIVVHSGQHYLYTSAYNVNPFGQFGNLYSDSTYALGAYGWSFDWNAGDSLEQSRAFAYAGYDMQSTYLRVDSQAYGRHLSTNGVSHGYGESLAESVIRFTVTSDYLVNATFEFFTRSDIGTFGFSHGLARAFLYDETAGNLVLFEESSGLDNPGVDNFLNFGMTDIRLYSGHQYSLVSNNHSWAGQYSYGTDYSRSNHYSFVSLSDFSQVVREPTSFAIFAGLLVISLAGTPFNRRRIATVSAK